MKRRCAGCNAVIDGRPNKLYCSKTCHRRAQRHRAKGTSKSDVRSGPVPSVIRGSNGVLIDAARRLGYVSSPVLDVTYGQGKWWTRYQPEILIRHDKYALDGVDFCELPEDDESMPVVCFDPPYISTGTREKSSVDDLYQRFGLGDLKGWRLVRKEIDLGLTQCARVLAPDGFLLVKCMDYVEGGHKIWNTFHTVAEGQSLGLELVDRFIHIATGKGGPQPGDNLDGSPREQKHAREVTSMLLVFTK